MSDQHAVQALARNKAVATGFIDGIVAGDIARCTALLAEDAVWWVQGWGESTGAAFLASLEQTIARASSRAFRLGLVTAEANRVAVQAWGELAFPEGIYANSYHYLFVIEHGTIRQGFEYFDTACAAAFYSR